MMQEEQDTQSFSYSTAQSPHPDMSLSTAQSPHPSMSIVLESPTKSVSTSSTPNSTSEKHSTTVDTVPLEKKGLCHRLMQLSHILSLSNAVMFPHLCSRYGGVAFLIAYLFAYFFVAVPVLCVEMGLGQFSSMAPIELFRKMSPSLAGIGVVMLIILTIKSISLSGIAAQSLFAGILTIIEGVRKDGPSWKDCNFDGAHPNLCFKYEYEKCYENIRPSDNLDSKKNAEFNGTCKGWMDGLTMMYNKTKDQRWHYWRPPHLDYLSAKIYQPIFHQSQWKFPVWVAIVLIFVWLLKATLSYIGVRKLGKIFVWLKMVMMLGFLVNLGLSIYFLPDGNDFYSFFDSDLSALANLEIWADAISHAINSLNLGSGAVHRISSFSQFNENFLANALLISGVDILFSFIIGMVFITSASSVAHRMFPGDATRHRLKFIFTHGFIATHTMFPEHIMWSLPSFGWVFAAIHYLKIGLLGIPSGIVCISIVRLAIEEFTLRYKKTKWGKHKTKLHAVSIGLLALFCCVSSIVLIGPNGFLLGRLWHEFSGVSLVFICLCEILSICLHYSFRRYLANVQTMLQATSQRVHMCYTFSSLWYHIFTPILLIVALFFKIFNNRRTRVLEYIFPLQFEFFGWFLVVFSATLIICPILRYLITFIRRTHSVAHLFEPLPGWGPIDKENFTRNMKNERAARVRSI